MPTRTSKMSDKQSGRLSTASVKQGAESGQNKKSKEKSRKDQRPTKRYGPRPKLTKKQYEELRLAFGQFDPRGTGLVETRSVITVLRAIGQEPKMEDLQALMDETMGPGLRENLDFKEFYSLVSTKMLCDDHNDELCKMFRSFTNDDMNSYIDLDNLTSIARELGETVSRDELSEMLSYADTDGDGRVSFEEFARILKRPEVA